MKKIIQPLVFVLLCTSSTFSQDLIQSEFLVSRTQAELIAEYNIPSFYSGVDLYKITYTTLDIKGVLDTASGLVAVPDLADKKYPLLCSQHGTIGEKDNVPSNLAGGYELTEVWGGMGYITFTPDLLGLGEARGFHPFVHAASEASAAIDMIEATKDFLDDINQPFNDQLFITGYSQGGHSAAALHQKLETNFSNEYTVTASAPMSGPYSLSGVMKDVIFNSTVPFERPSYVAYTILSYQTVYENLFTVLEDMFKPAYATLIQGFWDGNKTRDDLNDELIAQLTMDYGASYPVKMFQDDVVNQIMTNDNHPLNVALRDNDVYDWTPQAPTRLIYCEADEQVPYLNATVADSVMNMNGAIDVSSINADPDEDHNGCIRPALGVGIFFFGIYQQIDDVVDVHHPELKEYFTVFPNPVEDMVFVKNEQEAGMIQFINMDGRVLLETRLDFGTNPINVSNYPSGVYVLKVNYKESFATQKIILSR